MIVEKYLNEIWKDIPGYYGLYQVSSFGNVKNIITGKIKALTKTRGYLYVQLWKNNRQRNYLVHRIVALTFIPNPNNYPEVNHKDCNPLNNRVENLEWCTRVYNVFYDNAPLKRARKIAQYDLNGIFIREFSSQKEAAKSLGKKTSSPINECCKNGRYKSAYGYVWKYA